MAGALSRSGGSAAGEVARRDADDSLMRRLRKGRASTSIIAGESAPTLLREDCRQGWDWRDCSRIVLCYCEGRSVNDANHHLQIFGIKHNLTR